MSQNEKEQEMLQQPQPELEGETAGVSDAEESGYVESSTSVRVLAGFLAALMILGVILYLGWLSGILHE